MRIAIIGSGIAGLTAARKLCLEHEVTVFEANDYIGGHTNTIDVEAEGRQWAVDTGFIVFNDWTYPNFIALMKELGVASQPSQMGFSMRCARTGIEYCGSSLDQLFAQRANLASPRFWGMIRDILRFNRESRQLLEGDDDTLGLGAYLEREGYSRRFIDHYIVPMGAAIWSTDPRTMLRFPARYFVDFFNNHGLLSVQDRPQWHVIKGGSRSYVGPLTAPFADAIRLRTPVRRVLRDEAGVDLVLDGGHRERFDAVVFACHSDQALALLEQPTAAEREVLGAIPYQPNRAVLHTDTRVLPRRQRAWAAWNYHVPAQPTAAVSVTYHMNILQSLPARTQFLVTLNPTMDIDPAQVIREIDYQHPVYTPEGVAAQQRRSELMGVNRSFYCGAWWSYGFHEDGVKSGLVAAAAVQSWSMHAQLPLLRAS
ncbi:FAD-dependent oxidoreductase [Thioalkalivibrio sp. XN8]|uniref:FAD-dependent oxidoreductase n=1 Tax=Thioalkalivibrio sp. XN8 TaxID=2712863 RepID=UPI0013EBC91F|nr:NAD(P)-binding protein [Thioalkalivibrio sp. XN8]